MGTKYYNKKDLNMNNIIDNFPQIVEFAKQYYLPLTKKGAIVREYLQCMILDIIYREKISKDIFFVGGTSLRILRNLDRFSEDLDFDIYKVKDTQIETLMELVSKTLLKNQIEHLLYKNQTDKRIYFELRFTNLLYKLNLSANRHEKLTIKFDFERFWKINKTDVVLMNKYGFLANIVTLPLESIIIQKMYAYLHRKQTLARDLYDISWLLSHGAKMDDDFLRKNNLNNKLRQNVIDKYELESKNIANLKRRLLPFLIDDRHVDKIDYIRELISALN